MQIHIDIFIQICMAMSVNKCQAGLLAKGRAAPAAAAAAADATVNRLLEWKSIQKMQNNCIKMICIGFSIAQNS